MTEIDKTSVFKKKIKQTKMLEEDLINDVMDRGLPIADFFTPKKPPSTIQETPDYKH